MLKKTIKNRELTAMIMAVIMSLALVMVAAIGLSQTNKVITRLESESLPDMRIALGLAEGVAQLAAFAPYVASSDQPSLLQQQKARFEKRFSHLFTIIDTISDKDFRDNLVKKLRQIEQSADQLSRVVADSLLRSEELLGRHYQLKFFLDTQKRIRPDLLISELNSMEFLSDPDKERARLIEKLLQQLKSGHYTDLEPLQDFLTFAQHNDQQIATNNKRKQFLLISMRIQSEQLSEYVNNFANQIEHKVYQQQVMVKSLNNQVFWGMVFVMILLIVTVITNYGRNMRVIQELTSVTDDMVRLSTGKQTEEKSLQVRDDEVGELLSAYLTFRTHTEQIESVRDDLEQQKLLLETIFNGMYDGLSVFSAKNCLLAWNKQYLTSLNLKEGDVYRGMPLEAVLKLISSHGEVYKDISGQPVNFSDWINIRHTQDKCVERHDESGGIIEFRSQPMPNGGFITLTQDLTYRRETELQLQQAKKMEVLGQLTGGVSHDFNNFLTSISGNLQLLEIQSELSERSQKYVTRALRATENGSHLIRKLLAFSRKQVLEPESVLVEELISETQDLLEYSVSDGVALIYDLSVHHYRIKIDKAQLQNALLNLILNANGSITGSGQIMLATELVEHQAKPWLEVSVSDTGKGIPKAIQDRVFEAFFTTKPVGEGSGLGLSSVHGYVQQSGGEIGIESEPNQGTRVWMRWPIENDDLLLVSEYEDESVSELFTNSILLLIEDDRQVASTMTDLLSRYCKRVVHFLSADNAWEWLKDYHGKVACVLSDIHLSRSISGIEFRNQANLYYPELPVFLYSGMVKELIEQQFNCVLDDNFIAKPMTKEDIRKVVRAGQENEK
ncbi:hypothetical protein DI392_16125 [Vibrio albus]|uniref:histidine kinase n=1 Tax=Vibrio albus TaxID=2200953 RepID=A0A2U3B655_9VIBR|nr:PAS-domain containing protein [Vibrio albus]PWI32204.1 hypothetical protein DI392_16125 [Vibrio albus]